MLTFGLTTNRRIFYAGEVVTVYLEATEGFPAGHAVLRTNVGMAAVRRREIIAQVERNQRPAGRDWRDLPLKKVSDRRFELALMLPETGVFELKPFFSPEAKDAARRWPEGENLHLKVEAAENIGANLMYTAFVRQFGPNCARAQASHEEVAELEKLDRERYTVIPPSGTFRDVAGKLDFIFGQLGSRILQLLPIHPTPTVYGRMGRFGSPFASLDYFAVDPALAEFDPAATPLEQFGELVDAVHARKGRIFLDIPVNHTGWASRLQSEHPDWFVRDKQSHRIESPGAWGVVWADLCKLDYNRSAVQRYMAEVFLYWCRHGVDGFRCDAGYMLPAAAWRYIEAKVRNEYPDTVFMLEGLGGPVAKQEMLLGQCGLDWGYSELFQNYRRDEIENYVRYASRASRESGTLINFAETHDNNRLAATSQIYAQMRCALMVFLSDGGAFGFTNGVEWFATEKVDVHGAGALNWGAKPNMVEFLQRLHASMRLHPAFYGGAEKRLENLSGDPALAIRRDREDTMVLALVNLDCAKPARVRFSRGMWAGEKPEGYDLLNGGSCAWSADQDAWQIELAPGECRLLTPEACWLDELETELEENFRTPEAIRCRKIDLAAQKAWLAAGLPPAGDPQEAIRIFREDWRKLFRERPVAEYRDPLDSERLVMVPPGWCLAIQCPHAFRAELKDGDRTLRFERSVRLDETHCLALFSPLAPEEIPTHDPVLELTVFEPDNVVRRRGHVRYLPPEGHGEAIVLHFTTAELEAGPPRHALGCNHGGGYSQMQAEWGRLVSKYDALIAANLNPDYPVDRRIMLVRCRVWVVLNDFSQEVNFGIQETFRVGVRNLARWEFAVPVGQGRMIRLDITCRTAFNTNAVELVFRRRPAGGNARMLDDATPVRLIVRPDLDDRDNHAVTKAYLGPEQTFPRAVTTRADGLDFAPGADRRLVLTMNGCAFHRQDEWHYMNDFALEEYYGLEHQSDLYSPGYWEGGLVGRGEYLLSAAVNPEARVKPEFPTEDRFPATLGMMEAARSALDCFVVKRNEFRTVIAGYPWFLDWGRDTLIALRGLIAAQEYDAAREIILQFAGFERNGTIPNMIRGANDSNRDTSDAPLWLAVATADYLAATGDDKLLEMTAGTDRRPVLAVLESIAAHYRNGTANGIAADRETNLIFSPAHFTWMDTNYPAATPRMGYPVEIQALWFALQNFLARFKPQYQAGAEQTAESLYKYFYLSEFNRLSDCLHANPCEGARSARRDDALRPNELFAVTMKAVTEPALCRGIVENSASLLIPGAIRSLANLPVSPPLPVMLNDRLLNDPRHPYQGHYRGPEDTMRKAAYHNGTAWCWPFPSFVEALFMSGGDAILPAARALLESSAEYFNGGCPGQLPEVADGDYPHHWGGCAAQAWSVSEFYRVGKLLGL